MIIVGHIATGGSLPLPGTRWGGSASGLSARAGAAAVSLLIMMMIGALTISATYFFQGFDTWWSGMSLVLLHRKMGHPAFFLGEYSDNGWWSYFFVAFLIKTPIGTLFLVFTSWLLGAAGQALRRRELLFLLLPVVIVFAITTNGKINIGLRHILPVYPFLFVAASRLATLRFRTRTAGVLLIAVPIALSAASSWRVAPHQLAYFNELAGGPGKGYRYLSDSNIDWGQDLKGLRTYVRQQQLPIIYLAYFGNAPSDAYGFRYQCLPSFGSLEPLPADLVPAGTAREILAISVLNLHGIFFNDHTIYKWLLDRQPVAKIGYSIFIYDITRDVEAHLRLAEVYFRAGFGDFAIAEARKVLMLDPSNTEAAYLLSMPSVP